MTDDATSDPVGAFQAAIADAGLVPPRKLVPDGRLHRFAPNGDARDDAGWYVLHLDGVPAGSFGSWRHDISRSWSAKRRQQLTPEERRAQLERIQRAKRERQEALEKERAKTRAKAAEVWNRAEPAKAQHPYLARKSVSPPRGLRQIHVDAAAPLLGYGPAVKDEPLEGDLLVLPVTDGKRRTGLQLIDEAGRKHIVHGTAKRGCWSGFGKPVDVLVIAEGLATGASVRAAIEQPFAVAFDAGNLKPVAQALRRRFPSARILIAGDHDEPKGEAKEGVGQVKARAAAEAVGGVAVVPAEPGDWNDVHVEHGLSAVQQAFYGVLYPVEARAPDPDDYGEPAPLAADIAPGGNGGGGSDPDKPRIYIAGGALPRMVNNAEAALKQAGLPIYQRGAALVRLLRSEGKDSRGIKREEGAPMIVQVSAAWMREQMTDAAYWLKWDARLSDWKNVDAPKDVAETYLARVGDWRVPFLRGIVQAPTPRPDGSIITEPGYDAASNLVFDPGGVAFPSVPSRPGRADAEAALNQLRGLLRDFPFVSATDEAVAISGILTAIARLALETAPGHAMTAPAAGTGKSLLVDIASLIATGRRPAVLTDSRRISPEEAEKRLDTALLQGDPMLALDNLTRPLDSDRLCQMLTQPSIRVRILGQSQQPEVPSVSAIFATGNNLSIQGDLCRRFMLCHLDAGMEKPYERKFDYSILDRVRQHRAELAVAAVTIIRAYTAMERPCPLTPLGSFEEWSRLIREPLVWLGMADPVSSIDAMREEDPTVTTRRQLLNAWRAAFGDEAVTAARAVERAQDILAGEFVDPDLREAMMAAAPDRKGSTFSQLSVGQYLRKHKDVVTDGLCFTHVGTNRNKVALWRAVEVRNNSLNQSALVPNSQPTHSVVSEDSSTQTEPSYGKVNQDKVNPSENRTSSAGDAGDCGGCSPTPLETVKTDNGLIDYDDSFRGSTEKKGFIPRIPRSEEDNTDKSSSYAAGDDEAAHWDGDVGPEDGESE